MKQAILILCMLFTLLGVVYTDQALPPSVLHRNLLI